MVSCGFRRALTNSVSLIKKWDPFPALLLFIISFLRHTIVIKLLLSFVLWRFFLVDISIKDIWISYFYTWDRRVWEFGNIQSILSEVPSPPILLEYFWNIRISLECYRYLMFCCSRDQYDDLNDVTLVHALYCACIPLIHFYISVYES